MMYCNRRLAPIYAITDPGLLADEILLDAVESALKGGVGTVQLRNKIDSFAHKLKQANALVELCMNYNAQLIINDEIELARQSAAHGVHLGQSDGSVEKARDRLGSNALIGVTCHSSLEMAHKAEQQGADYIAFGRFFASTTKPNTSMAPLTIIHKAKQELSIPVVAIGGITRDNMQLLIDCGADSLAVCHSLFAAKNIERQAQLMLRAFSTRARKSLT